MSLAAPDSADVRHEQELLTCVHCGFCLNSCPTYLENGSEADSPRGRITMMRAIHEGALGLDDPSVRKHLDACLGCRACEPACPSGVPYGSLIEYARAQINTARPPIQRFARKAVLNTLSSPTNFNMAARLARIAGARVSNIPLALLRHDRIVSQSPTLPPIRFPLTSVAALPKFIPAIGHCRARVGLLTGCVMRSMYGDVNYDTAVILAANGCDVVINQRQGCCGALHLHNGELQQGKALAWQLIDAFGSPDELDAIVINSAGCGSTMKEYGKLFAADALRSGAATTLAAKCRDVSEFLDDLGWSAPLKPIPVTAAYHDACHLAQAQRITAAPRRLLDLIPELVLKPLPESEVCCGSAGIYNLTEPAMARRLQARKLDSIAKAGASMLVTGNPGCMAWIESGLKDRGQDSMEVLHPATLMRRALVDAAEPNQ